MRGMSLRSARYQALGNENRPHATFLVGFLMSDMGAMGLFRGFVVSCFKRATPCDWGFTVVKIRAARLCAAAGTLPRSQAGRSVATGRSLTVAPSLSCSPGLFRAQALGGGVVGLPRACARSRVIRAPRASLSRCPRGAPSPRRRHRRRRLVPVRRRTPPTRTTGSGGSGPGPLPRRCCYGNRLAIGRPRWRATETWTSIRGGV